MTRRELIEHCLTYPAAFEDCPFDGEWTLMRYGANRKAFACIFRGDGRDFVSLRCDPDKSYILRALFRDVKPALHIDGRCWNTVLLEGDVPDADLLEMVAHSFALIKPKNGRTRKKSALNAVRQAAPAVVAVAATAAVANTADAADISDADTANTADAGASELILAE
jgi:predicted DNA-binding protein (MmcQ/YjbR family)